MKMHVSKARVSSFIILPALVLLMLSPRLLSAQRLGINLNVSGMTSSTVKGEDTNGLAFNGSTNLGLDVRYFTRSKIGLRAGVGVENLNYSIDNGITTDFSARRKDLKGKFGLEWHPFLGKWIDIYPGAYIPITVTGRDVVEENLASLTGGNFSAGLGLVLGANIRFLKIFRAGVEFDASYQNFKSAAVESIETGSVSPMGRMNRTLNFTFGVLL